MNTAYKPDGYNSVSVYIMAEEPLAVIDFLQATFDAQPLRRFDRPDGSLAHGELRLDDTIVMIAAASAEDAAFQTWLHVYVPDVDDVYRRALAAGGRSIMEPTVRGGDSDKRGAVADPAGNTWWISTQQ